MRLFCLTILTTLLVPRLCLAQPEIPEAPEVTDDITNSSETTQPEQAPLPDDSVAGDSVEVVMPATPVLGLPNGNVTFRNSLDNATMPLLNGTIVEGNATIPVYNATIPGYNATIPDRNGTLPVHNATLPDRNATIPSYNATMPVHNATLPQVTTNTPVSAQHPPVSVTPPKVVSIADFLIKTPGTPTEPEKTEPQKPESQKPAKAEPPKNVADKKEPNKPAPVKTAPPAKKTEPPATQKVAPGKGLKIPPDAAKTGDLSFLEGCWKGYRPEYHSKRMITERFCFNASGVGKRIIKDPAHAGECYGATRALLNKDGVLHMDSQEAVCTNGSTWGASEMICKGEGEQTPCYWKFIDIGNASQSYKISFVRE